MSSHLRASWASLVANREDPAYPVACAAIRDLQNGEIDVDEAALRVLEACDDEEDRAVSLFGAAITWWNSLAGYKDRNGQNIPRTAARYIFDVPWSDSKDSMMAGGYEDGWSRVTVEADNLLDAELAALQIVYCRHQPSGGPHLVDPGEDYRE